MRSTVYTICIAILVLAVSASAQISWLDRPLTANWNSGNGVVPQAPRSSASSPNSAMCRSTLRAPESLNDRALSRAGWFLYGPSYSYGTINIVTAMASVDGMCRPNQYNGFVFVGNRFAGTLAREHSDARSDGAMGQISFFNPENLTVEFARYTSNDAMCCPSQASYVTYEITTGTRPLVKAEQVDTRANCDQSGPIQTQDNVVSGTVTYRQRSALPRTAYIIVRLVDVSRADAPSTTIAEQRIEAEGRQVPFEFAMAYDRGMVQDRNRYAVRAEIRDGDRLLFTTDTSYPVITQGNPRTVEITVVPVGGGGRPGRGDTVIRGNVTYRQRIALAANSEVTVRLVDAAAPEGSAVAETTFNTNNRQVPIPFELDYEQRQVNRQRNYELQAEIRTDGRLVFKTPAGQPVTLRGNQAQNIELVLEAASEGPEAITGRTINLSKFGTGSLQIGSRGNELIVRGSVSVDTSGNATVTLSRPFGGSTAFTGKLTHFDETTLRITVESSGDADASGELTVNYSGRSLRSITASDLVLDGQSVTLRF